MYKKLFFLSIFVVLALSMIGCSNQPTSRTTQSSTSSTTGTSTSTQTSQTGTTTRNLVVGTMLEADDTLNTHLAGMAQSMSAKAVLADFYTYFMESEIYIWAGTTITEMESDAQIMWKDFDAWEIAYFVSAKSWDLFPDLFNGIFTMEQELVHPASDLNTASYKYTMALRWNIDPLTGEVTTKNDNAMRFEAELIK